MASEIVMTIAEQVLSGYDPLSRRPKLIAVDENTLRTHLKLGRKTINVDITYDHGMDHYNVKRYISFDGMLTYSTESFEGMYFDQLPGLTAGYND